MRFAIVSMLVVFAPLALGCQPMQGPAQKSPQPGNTAGVVRVDTVARGLERPWALAFLPDGRVLVTERPGRLRIVARDGSVSAPVAGVPEVMARGQGGLLDVAIDPAFATNRLVYLSYSEPGEGGTAGTSVARGRLGDGRLENVQVIYRQQPKKQGASHFGSRLVFSRDGKLFVTQGDRGSAANRVEAQELGSGVGKIVRIDPDGSIPRDNPFVGQSGARPEIWSWGHRNAQAAVLNPENGDLWEIEHGPRGGDELNRVQKGKNYGWPAITYGLEYSGTRVSESTTREGMEQPVYYWDPVIAPSGMIFYTGDVYPGWKGNVLVGSMTPGGLVRLTLRDNKVASEERYFLGQMRVRDVQQGPDGHVYMVTDATDGVLLKLLPARR